MSCRRHCHLDERTGTILGEGRFQIPNCDDLSRPQALGHEFRRCTQLGAKRRTGMLKLLRKPLIESLRAVKTEDAAAAGIRLQEIGKASLYSCALVLEGQRSARGDEIVWYAFTVLGGLQLNSSERVPFFLGLDDSDGRSIDEEKIVSLA